MGRMDIVPESGCEGIPWARRSAIDIGDEVFSLKGFPSAAIMIAAK